MNLFRGDNIFNKNTNPELYRNNGLRTKAFGSGCNPQNIELLGLQESIRKHVKPENSSDRVYFDVTDFLSFSEERDRAVFWCSDKGKLILDKADDYNETRYLFILNIDDNSLREFGKGIYSFEFRCNPQLKLSDSGKEPLNSLLRFIHSSEICSICSNQNRTHRILLINSFEYLIQNTQHAKFEDAICYAEKDKEWLVLPFDPLGKYRSSRIPRADFWTVEHFIGKDEKRPELNLL